MKPIHKVLHSASEATRAVGEETAKDAERLRRDIDDLLRRQETRILVVIDDLDRLSTPEIRQMFRLIKAVADFPQTVYLLAFDHDVVASVLADDRAGGGEDFLAKIVQAPFSLPLPDRSGLRKLLFDELDLLLGKPDPDLWDQTEWGNVFHDGIDPFIRTPRDVKRYVNALRVSYPPVKDEVNPIDFLAIECLRVFAPAAYDAVRNNQALYAGGEEFDRLWGDKPEDRRPRYEELMAACKQSIRSVVKTSLSRLFPKFHAAFDGAKYGREWEPEWRLRRMCRSPEHFDVYFRLSVKAGAISSAEMRRLLSLTGDPQALATALRQLATEMGVDGRTSRARAFLERLEDHTKADIPVEHIPTVIEALYDAGDDLVLPQDEGGMWGHGNDMQVLRLAYQLITRIPDREERFRVLRPLLENCRSIYTPIYEISIWRQEWEEGAKRNPPREEFTVPEERLLELESLAIRKLEVAAMEGRLATAPHLDSILFDWKRWAGDDPPAGYTQDLVKTDEGLATLLVGFLRKHLSQGGDDRVARTTWRVLPKSVATFVPDTDSLFRQAARVLEDSPAWLDPRKRLALEAFVDECRNPDKYRH